MLPFWALLQQAGFTCQSWARGYIVGDSKEWSSRDRSCLQPLLVGILTHTRGYWRWLRSAGQILTRLLLSGSVLRPGGPCCAWGSLLTLHHTVRRLCYALPRIAWVTVAHILIILCPDLSKLSALRH